MGKRGVGNSASFFCMKFGSVCSGIEAPSVAWAPLGWEPIFFSEIDSFAKSVLKYRHPNVPNLGDMRKFEGWPDYEIDVLIGGTPCQSFSVIGNRGGVSDERGNLTKTFVEIIKKIRPRHFVWENVPGVLSSNGGRDFGAFLGALVQCGYGVSYRVLDAKFFGVPQKRRRLFVVGSAGNNWRASRKILFESDRVRGDHPPRRKEESEKFAKCLTTGIGKRYDLATEFFVIVEKPIDEKDTRKYPLVRRPTPRECERLMGLPDDYTLVPHKSSPARDKPRYKAIGNSMVVPVIRWLGENIQEYNRNEIRSRKI